MNKIARYKANIAGALIGALIWAPIYGWANYAEDGGVDMVSVLMVGAVFGGLFGGLTVDCWKTPGVARMAFVAGALIGAALLARPGYIGDGWDGAAMGAWWGAVFGVIVVGLVWSVIKRIK